MRVARDGANEIPDERPNPVFRFLAKFWAPVPWMLEVALVLEVVLGHRVQAAIIGALLVTNAALAFLEEHRADQALALPKRHPSLRARVFRNGQWQGVSALARTCRRRPDPRAAGDLVPANLRVTSGGVLDSRS